MINFQANLDPTLLISCWINLSSPSLTLTQLACPWFTCGSRRRPCLGCIVSNIVGIGRHRRRSMGVVIPPFHSTIPFHRSIPPNKDTHSIYRYLHEYLFPNIKFTTIALILLFHFINSYSKRSGAMH